MDDLSKVISSLTERENSSMSRSEWKQVVREALREEIQLWLDRKAQEFGKGSFNWLLAAAGAAICYFAVTHSGWVKP